MSCLRVAVRPDEHVRGSTSATLTLVEYGDYQCPFCGAAVPELEAVRHALGDALRFVFRHFPLGETHPLAMQAAEAAEAAGAQRRFWAMHDMLYRHQDALDAVSLLAYADAIDLDVDRFALDLQEHRHVAKLRADFLGGVHSGVNGTPNLFVNGRQYHGHVTAQALIEVLSGPTTAAVLY